MQNSLRKAFVYRNVASIVAETELIKVSLHMLTANPVVYTIDRTFAIIPPKGFNRVRICATVHIDIMTMVNNVMLIDFRNKSIPLPLIRVYRGGVLNLT